MHKFIIAAVAATSLVTASSAAHAGCWINGIFIGACPVDLLAQFFSF